MPARAGSHSHGLAWSRIREVADLQGRTPNLTRVYRMEKEHGLHRVRDGRSLQVVWKLDPTDGAVIT